MTELGVERTLCAMYPAPSVLSTGVTEPLPPHIQGAERRRESRARHTGSRWGLRVLVVGGLAGAAWLLTGAAAHAADRSDEPVGSSAGSVVDGVSSDNTVPMSGLREAAAQPLETVRPAHDQHHVVIGTSAITHEQNGMPADVAIDDADHVPGEAADPNRLIGGPAADDVTDDMPAAAPRVVPVARRRSPVLHQAFRAPDAARPVVRGHGKVRASSGHRHRTAAHAARPGPDAVRRDTVRRDIPGGTEPAAPLHVGDVSGTSTSWSGTPTGGSAAFLPDVIVSNPPVCRRLPITSEVEVRRCDAEAPTVSPD